MRYFRPTLALIRAIWKSLTYLAGIVGLLYLWPDIRDLPKGYGYTWEFPNWLDREAIAYVGLAVAGLWLLWIDVRPMAKGWWQKHHNSSDFTISEKIHCETHIVRSPSAGNTREFYENVFYLVVGNDLDTGRTLRRAQARIFHLGPPVLCRIKDSDAGEIDIRHGEWAFFEIGRLVSKEMMGPVQIKNEDIDEKRLKVYRHNIPQGYLSFEVRSVNNNREYGLGFRPDSANVWSVFVAVSADDVKSSRVNINIDMANTRAPVSCELVT